MSDVVPLNEGPHILSVVLLPTVPPMRSNCSDPVDLRDRSAGESSIRLSIELALKNRNSSLPMLGVFYFKDEDTSKGDWSCRHLHNLNDEVGNVILRIVRKATLGSDNIALGRGEEGCEYSSPRPIPCVFSGRGD